MREKFSPNKKVQLRGGFSDRNGIDKINTEIQLKDFDDRTRIAIQNALNYIFAAINESCLYKKEGLWTDFYLDISANVYCEEVKDAACYRLTDIKPIVEADIRSTIMNDSYDSVLTLVEYILNWTSANFTERLPLQDNNNNFKLFDEKRYMNNVFEKEFVGYRFVGKYIVPITDDVEIEEINQSLDITFKGCKTQIQNALRLLSDRNNPDYKNSIKESISAVESICCIIAGKVHSTLGDALNILEKKHKLNSQLKAAFTKLYSYTNDEGGIRHAEALFESNVSFEEAKFMLVSCCAFVNYLIAEYDKIGA